VTVTIETSQGPKTAHVCGECKQVLVSPAEQFCSRKCRQADGERAALRRRLVKSVCGIDSTPPGKAPDDVANETYAEAAVVTGKTVDELRAMGVSVFASMLHHAMTQRREVVWTFIVIGGPGERMEIEVNVPPRLRQRDAEQRSADGEEAA
jgi:endogenous inhibitor of DNA gyrase (YacG/DUF329 family)